MQKPMKNKKLIILVIILAMIMAVALWYAPLFPFAAVFSRTGGGLMVSEMNVGLECKNICRVLDYYDELYYQLSDESILIPLPLYLDLELRWNYTTKANDSEWLATH